MEKLTPKEPTTVACEVCLQEIPESVAMNSEADEYVQHFCGVDCYQQWHAKEKPTKANDNAD